MWVRGPLVEQAGAYRWTSARDDLDSCKDGLLELKPTRAYVGDWEQGLPLYLDEAETTLP